MWPTLLASVNNDDDHVCGASFSPLVYSLLSLCGAVACCASMNVHTFCSRHIKSDNESNFLLLF